VEKLLPPGSDGEGVAKPLRDALLSARESGRRLNRTLSRMKSLTNLDRAEEQTIDLNALWQDTAALLEAELAPKAEVRFELQTVPPIRARPEQISAVFSNLLRNAAAAMDSKGVIEVRTSSADGELVSEVRDTGAGMSEETLSQLFEPAFRVEGSRVSTSNWGLFVSRSIVVEHGGSIEVASELGQGTTVRVVLPVR
jgi:signal transduction histidine kinase